MKKIYASSVRSLVCCLFLSFSTILAMAQERKVSGKIIDMAGGGIPGRHGGIKRYTTWNQHKW